MDAASMGFFLGALAATFLVSRLVLLVIPKNVGFARYLLANGLSLAAAMTLSAMGKANGGPLDWSDSGLYVLAQAVWVTVDLIRANKRARAAQAGDVHSSAPVPAVGSDQVGAQTSAPAARTWLLLALFVLLAGSAITVALLQRTTVASTAAQTPPTTAAEGSFVIECREPDGGRWSILRILPSNMTADWSNYRNKPFIVLEHSGGPSLINATINQCLNQTVCDVIIDGETISARTDVGGPRWFRISRVTGDYRGTITTINPGYPDSHWAERGHCAPLDERAF